MPGTKMTFTQRGLITIVVMLGLGKLGAWLVDSDNRQVAAPEAAASSQAAILDAPQETPPLTLEQKVENVQHYFGGIKGVITLGYVAHDAYLGRMKLDMQAGDLADARKSAHDLIQFEENSQSQLSENLSRLVDNGDIDQTLIDGVEEVANAVLGDLSGSATSLATAVDFGMPASNTADLNEAAKDMKRLRGLMLSVYKIYGYAPGQINMDTWRLKDDAKKTAKRLGASAPPAKPGSA